MRYTRLNKEAASVFKKGGDFSVLRVITKLAYEIAGKLEDCKLEGINSGIGK